MLNRGETGSMVYEPDFLRVAPGDRVRFLATHPSHNAASIPEIWPDEVPQVKGRINEEIEISFDAEGIYGIKCSPHYTMGMVMLIQVGAADPGNAPLPDSLPETARDRITAIIGQHAP